MTDPFIDQLVGDLRPTKYLANWKLWMHCTACLFLIAAMIIGLMGLRPDYTNAMQTGSMFWKPAIFFFMWLGTVLMITDLSRPVGRIKRLHILPLVLGMSLLFWQFLLQMGKHSIEDMIESLYDKSAFVCLPVIFVGGTMAMGLAWKFWFSKTASQRPILLGFLAGLSAGVLTTTAYSLHCDHDMAAYITIYYGAPIFLLSSIGAFLGKKFLSW